MTDPKVKHIPHVTMLFEGQLLYINAELHRFNGYDPGGEKVFTKLTVPELVAVEALLKQNRDLVVNYREIQEYLEKNV